MGRRIIGRGAQLDPVKDGDPTLDHVEVYFVLPDGDDRDHDTVTEISVKTKTGTVIASSPSVAPGQHLKDPGTYGPYGLSKTGSCKASEFHGGTATLTITPNGHDHWITNVLIYAYFGQSPNFVIMQADSGTFAVDQDNREAEWGI